MRRLTAEQSDAIRMGVDETVELESLRLAVVPPHVLVVPFTEEPDVIEILRQDSLGEDGVHGSVYAIKAVKTGQGRLRLGFRDLRSGETVAEKEIDVTVG